MGKRVIGPAVPGIPRVRGQYLLVIMIKLEKNPKKIKTAKEIIAKASILMKGQKGFSAVRVNVDVDPQ